MFSCRFQKSFKAFESPWARPATVAAWRGYHLRSSQTVLARGRPSVIQPGGPWLCASIKALDSLYLLYIFYFYSPHLLYTLSFSISSLYSISFPEQKNCSFLPGCFLCHVNKGHLVSVLLWNRDSSPWEHSFRSLSESLLRWLCIPSIHFSLLREWRALSGSNRRYKCNSKKKLLTFGDSIRGELVSFWPCRVLALGFGTSFGPYSSQKLSNAMLCAPSCAPLQWGTARCVSCAQGAEAQSVAWRTLLGRKSWQVTQHAWRTGRRWCLSRPLCWQRLPQTH